MFTFTTSFLLDNEIVNSDIFEGTFFYSVIPRASGKEDFWHVEKLDEVPSAVRNVSEYDARNSFAEACIFFLIFFLIFFFVQLVRIRNSFNSVTF